MNNNKKTIDENPTLSLETTVYVGVPYRELYKIDNFPSLSNTKNIVFCLTLISLWYKCSSIPIMHFIYAIDVDVVSNSAV
jgi:hypothetical protein